tara:strand:+ start:3795 stop:4682 length:888 start_codon:yes stop_codon:yes gene_type:complete
MKNTYLNPNVINQIDNLYLKAKMIVEGYMSGLHKSPYHGFSIEFSEHRAYGIGDAVKNIDWKIWSKTDKYYIKRFEEETNLLAHIFLDSSKSMNFSSINISKFEYSKMIVAILSYLMMQQKDATGLVVFDSEIKSTIPPKNNKSHLNTILSIIENTKIGNDTNISKILHLGAEKIKKRGLVILISDLLDEPNKVIDSLKHFKYNNNEVLVFHIMDPKEINLDYDEPTIFKDLETNQTIEAEPWQINQSYEKEIKSLIKYYKTECSINKIDYNLIITNQKIEWVLSQFLNKRKKLL